jgi:hypothetical protein
MGTVQRIFRDLGLPRLRRTRKRVPKQMKLFKKAEPGESGQVDVKFVKIAGRLGISVHRAGWLHAIPGPSSLSAAPSALELGVPRRTASGIPVPHPEAAM